MCRRISDCLIKDPTAKTAKCTTCSNSKSPTVSGGVTINAFIIVLFTVIQQLNVLYVGILNRKFIRVLGADVITDGSIYLQ